MQCNEIRNYFADYIKEGLENSMQAEFSRHLKECPACNAELEALTDLWVKLGSVPPGEPASSNMDVRFHGAVEEYKQELNDAPRVGAVWNVWNVWNVRKRQSLLAVAAVAVFVIFVSAAIVRSGVWSGLTHAVAGIVDGSLDRIGGGKTGGMQAGDSIRLGDIVRSNGGAGATLALADGSRVEMRSRSELSLESADDGVRIRLNGGGIIVSAAKQRSGHLYVTTKDVTVSVVGTVFLVNSEEAGSRVAVIQGEVRVQQGATSKSLRPGEQVATNPLMESHPVSEEISWSRSAPEHMALLQQSTAPRGTSTEPSRLGFAVVSIRPSSWRGPRSGPPAAGESLGFGCHGTDGIPQMPVPQGRCVGNGVTVARLINYAFGGPWRFGSGIPDWARTSEEHENEEYFQIEAAAENPSTTTAAQLKLMLQAMLADRFRLQLHRETQEVQAYVFHIAKNGPKLKEATGDIELPSLSLGIGMHGKTSLDTLAQFLTEFVIGFANLGFIDTPFINRTGLTGIYEYAFRLRPSGGAGRGGGDAVSTGPPSKAERLSQFASDMAIGMEDQLGLRLDTEKIPFEIIVVDHIEKPSEN